MKKFLLSSLVIVAFVGYSLHQQLEGASVVSVVGNTPVSTNAATNQLPPSSPPQQNIPTGTYKDGQYTGNVADAFYGNVQVKAIISGGKITNVQFLDYPHDRRTSIEINSQAMPMLTSEAIQAQSSQVDVISGATATSGAFIESLKSALSQAKV